ncbi:hypothetical protein Tco_1206203, partial [Tanacetum coccineum]
MHILMGSEWCMMAIVEIPKTDPVITLSEFIKDGKAGPHGSGGSRKDGDGDTSFQWSQFTTPCSHLMLLIKDIMTNERPTTQLLQL